MDAFHYSIKKSATYSKAAVSCAHPLASRAGVMMMQQGGNAFDAAVATQLALAVVYSGAGNIGGGGFMMARNRDGRFIALDYREKAPGHATETMYQDSAGNVNTGASINGRLAVGVPGTIAGLFATLKYCRLPFKTLVQPAIDLARNGYAITASEAQSLNDHRESFLKYNDHPVAFVRDVPWKAGDTLIQKDLAATLIRLQKKGSRDFYSGATAAMIVKEMKKGNGLITMDDLKKYQAKERAPLEFNYKGYDVVSFPPPSSGGILLAQMLKMIEKYPLGSYGFQSLKTVHLMTEAERRAYADRAAYMGDPDFYHVPLKTLISEQYLAQRMADYDTAHAGSSKNTGAGEISEHMETTHISVIDAEGNMVSVTTTLNGSYGSKTVVEGAGFFLNNEMDDFSAKPGVPNMYGAVGGKANAIEPGKRMLSSMTPTLVMKDNKPFLVVGTPGGTTIPTSVFQTIVNIVDFDMNIQDAVNKPKFHHQWLPDVIGVEPGFNEETKKGLINMGYKIENIPAIGRMEVIEVKDNKIEVCGDCRGDDSVDGF